MYEVTGGALHLLQWPVTARLPRGGAALGGMVTPVHLVAQPHPLNGLMLAAGALKLMAGVALANSVLRRADGSTPIDRFVARWLTWEGSSVRQRPQLPAVAMMAGLLLVATLLHDIVGRTVFYGSPEDAGKAFAAISHVDVVQTVSLAYVVDDQGVRHVTWLTPGFIRAAEANGVRFGVWDRPNDFPIPGLLPIIALLALAIWQLRQPRSAAVAARSVLGFGIVSLYVVVWIGVVESGVLFRDLLIVDPDVLGTTIELLLAGGLGLGLVHRRVERGQAPQAALEFWVALLFAAFYVALVLEYVDGPTRPGSPGKLWVLAYGVAGALCLIAATPPMGQAVSRDP
jgi:hypothetical protein